MDGNSENIEMTTVGKMYIKDGLWRLIYRENSDDLAASSVTTLAVDAFGAVSLDRSGSADSHMTVQKGKRHMSLYTMGPVRIHTRHLRRKGRKRDRRKRRKALNAIYRGYKFNIRQH